MNRASLPITVAVLIFAQAAWSIGADARSRTGYGQSDRASIQNLVIREAGNMGVSAALALAVAQAESNFDPRARSHKGARGVMQIMPKTAAEEYGIAAGLLWNPRINIRLGLHFLRRLLAQYEGRVDLALSYYNGGSAVGVLPRARVLPATRKYVDKVQRLRRQFSRKLNREEQPFGYRLSRKSGSRGRQEF